MEEVASSSEEASTRVHESPELSESQRERIQCNKDKAKAIRQARLQSKPYDMSHRPHNADISKENSLNSGKSGSLLTSSQSGVCSTSTVSRDTGGGFLLEEEDEILREGEYRVVEEDAPVLPDEQMTCSECGKRFAESYLFSKFSFNVCDQCRDPKDKHSLITKTEAKKKYLLKDCDFGERGGDALPFILKRNPHSSHWGDMYLYLALQVEIRSHEVWGGREGLEEEHERKREAREKTREKKYAKEIKDLRKAVRSSLRPLSSAKSHEHDFSAETYCAETDVWTKTCSECGHQISYEKM